MGERMWKRGGDDVMCLHCDEFWCVCICVQTYVHTCRLEGMCVCFNGSKYCTIILALLRALLNKCGDNMWCVCVYGGMGMVIITYSDTSHSVSFFSLSVCVLWCV